MQHDRNRGQDPNRASNMEPAEGSRETARNADQEHTRSDATPRDRARNKDSAPDDRQGAGITNRDEEREHAEQAQVPPRGRTRDDRG
jgi:hypothetical protein